MHKVIGFLGVVYFSMGLQEVQAREAVVQVNSDISVSCYFTVSVIKNSGRSSYRVVASSPRDCGAVDEATGKLLETKVNLYCPRGYDAVGIPRGGPTGSYRTEIYYEAQGMCRSAYYLPLDAIDLFGPGERLP